MKDYEKTYIKSYTGNRIISIKRFPINSI